MAAKKSLEELRASQRERARRWRDKNRRTHLERVKAVYGRSKAQQLFPEGVTPQEVERYGKEVQETRLVSVDSVEGDEEVMRRHAETVARYAARQMEPERKVVEHDNGGDGRDDRADRGVGGEARQGEGSGAAIGGSADRVRRGEAKEDGFEGAGADVGEGGEKARRIRFQELKEAYGKPLGVECEL